MTGQSPQRLKFDAEGPTTAYIHRRGLCDLSQIPHPHQPAGGAARPPRTLAS